MNSIESLLKKMGYAYDSDFRKEKEDRVEDVRDFFRSDSRVTVVKLVDKYQVMVYDGKMIHSSVQITEVGVVEYLKGIL